MNASSHCSVLQLQLLLQLGDRLRRLRKAQGWSAVALAGRLGISRKTLSAIEAGDPSPSMGTYLMVMSAVGVLGTIDLQAFDAARPETGDDVAGPSPDGVPVVRIVVSADTSHHRVQDLQSIALHEAAVRCVRADPELLKQAQLTLQRWLASGSQSSASLWLQWKDILEHREWRKVLARTQRAQELRQASPLTTVLPPPVRQRILNEISDLKKGVVLEIRDAPWAAARPSKLQPKNAAVQRSNKFLVSRLSSKTSMSETTQLEDDVTTLSQLVQRIVEESGEPLGFDARLWVNQWLSGVVPALGHRRPLNVLKEPGGLEIVRNLLLRTQAGAFS